MRERRRAWLRAHLVHFLLLGALVFAGRRLLFPAGAPGSYTGTNRFDVIRERAWTSPIWYEPPLDL